VSSSSHAQATNPTDAYWAFDPYAAIRPDDPWFVDLEKLVPREHYGVSRKLRRNLEASARRPEFVHVGLMGHTGTGKSTLAHNALRELSRDGLVPVYINAQEVFDQSGFRFADIVLVLAESVVTHAAERGLSLGASELESVRAWFAEELVVEDHRTQLLGSVETSAEAERLTTADIDKAGRWLGGRRTSSLRPEDLPRVVELHRTHRILDTDQDRRLLQRACVLAYDGTEWWDVHPAIWSDDLFLAARREAEANSRGDG